MRVVIAPDSFKGTLGAAQVAASLAAGWREVRAADEVACLPMADGGEGTLDAIRAARPDARRMPVAVQGPDGRTHAAEWLLLPDGGGVADDHDRNGDDRGGGIGVIELAATSGLTLLDRLRPFDAHTVGFGQAIAAALRHGVRGLLLAIGGSSSTDGGTGMLRALGARFQDAGGAPIPLGGGGLDRLVVADLDGLPALPPGGAEVLSDVTNPLCGPRGAAFVYGEQKGADAAARSRLDAGLAHLAGVVGQARASDPGAGAAGGTGFGLLVWGDHAAKRRDAGAEGEAAGRLVIVSGARRVARAIGLPQAVAGADVIVTGEGRFDGQSSEGKAPWLVSGLPSPARRYLAAGSIEAPTPGFAAAVSLVDLASGLAAAKAEPERWLQRAGAELARLAQREN
ncbi:MAG TPA: glycerate kinase [Microbacteriaceae bacterium]|nr:glycerate kinase [Microbacteriaceae bacterium]